VLIFRLVLLVRRRREMHRGMPGEGVEWTARNSTRSR
jgi:hypothetical protein